MLEQRGLGGPLVSIFYRALITLPSSIHWPFPEREVLVPPEKSTPRPLSRSLTADRNSHGKTKKKRNKRADHHADRCLRLRLRPPRPSYRSNRRKQHPRGEMASEGGKEKKMGTQLTIHGTYCCSVCTAVSLGSGALPFGVKSAGTVFLLVSATRSREPPACHSRPSLLLPAWGP